MDSSLSSAQHALPEMTSITSPNSWASTSQPSLPIRPQRVAIPEAAYKSTSRYSANASEPVYSEKAVHSQHRPSTSRQQRRPQSYSLPSHGNSVSDGSSVMTGHTADTIDLEKAMMVAESRRLQHSRQHSAAPEMADWRSSNYLSSNTGSATRHGHSPYARYDVDADAEQYMLDQRQIQESNAVRIILFLSLPCVALSFLLCLYALLASLAIFITAPIRLCTSSRSSIWDALLSTLTSAQRLQLRCIYHSSSSSSGAVLGKSVAALLANLVISPFLSLGVAIAAWTVAVYWIFAAIIGDPDGTEGGNDGVETVLCLRGWWERWLVRAVVE